MIQRRCRNADDRRGVFTMASHAAINTTRISVVLPGVVGGLCQCRQMAGVAFVLLWTPTLLRRLARNVQPRLPRWLAAAFGDTSSFRLRSAHAPMGQALPG